MSTVFDNMYPSSFKGVPFFYIGGDTSGGRKTVTFEYPNKNFRFIEDLGENLKTFTIRGIIKGLRYDFDKRALIDALSSEGIGTFVHPHLGNIQCYATGYSVTENLNKTGVADFSMNFSQTEKSQAPNASRNNISAIADLYLSIYVRASGYLNDNYNPSTSQNISFAGLQIIDLSERMLDIANTISSIKDNDTVFTQQSKLYQKNAFKIASPAGDIGTETSQLISSFDSLSTDGQTRFDASQKLIGFGLGDDFLNINTIPLLQRNNNTKFINGLINGLAFINVCDSAKNIEFKTEDDLNEVSNTIDKLYDLIIDATTNKFSADFLNDIENMRNQIRLFFDQQRLIVNKIVEIQTNPIPMTVLAYKYYGNTNEYNDLLDINNITNPARVSGELKILEQ